MKSIRELHKEAMDLAEMALVAKLRGDLTQANQLFRQAFEKESQAARLVPDEPSAEPTRSVLYRSAATLALDCREWREAERLIAAGLAGDPPEEIAEELRELFTTVRVQRHLDLAGAVRDTEADSKTRRQIITGRLLYADATTGHKNIIRLIDEEGQSHLVLIPKGGMMRQIVKPLWGETVTVTGSYRGREMELADIRVAAVA